MFRLLHQGHNTMAYYRMALVLILFLLLADQSAIATADTNVLADVAVAADSAVTTDSTVSNQYASGVAERAVPATLRMFGVDVVTIYSSFIASKPEQRVSQTQQRILDALEQLESGVITRRRTLYGTTFLVDGMPTVFLTELDYDPSVHHSTTDVVPLVEDQLRAVIIAWREQRSVPDLLMGIGLVIVATIVVFLLLRGLSLLYKRLAGRLLRRIVRRLHERGIRDVGRTARFVPIAVIRLLGFLYLFLVVFSLYSYFTFCLNRFPVTRTLGHQMRGLVFDATAGVADDVIAALPNVITLVVILVTARFLNRWIERLLAGVEKGQFTVAGLDRDTAVPTKRIITTLVWVFALALAYPFIPGSSSQAFQGVSVLFGLMVSLGASGTIGQAMSGLVLLYSRSMRVGDHVTVGETTGSVLRLGFFAVRLRTAFQQEVTIPNSVLVASMIVNHTRLVPHGTSYTTSVTIGYDAPWRLVHAMLLEAARRTDDVELENPAPYVVQFALSDFYVEYRLTCAIAEPTKRPQVISALHSNIQDVFNENNVQIMSPHYEGDPAHAKLVPDEQKDVQLRVTKPRAPFQ